MSRETTTSTTNGGTIIDTAVIGSRKVKEVDQFSTKDYTQFSFFKGNRPISRSKVVRLRKSIRQKDLTRFYPILVNGDMEILDGQHRYIACSELGIPIQYNTTQDIDISTVAKLNNSQDKWNAYDFLNAWVESGIHDYRIFAGFMKKYDLNFSTAFAIFFDGWGGSMYYLFKTGEMKINNLKEATEKADMLESLKESCERCSDRYFVLALMDCFKHPDYDHNRMKGKMKYLGSTIKKASNKGEYLRQIENVYNARTSSKVRFW
jgi:hypothetical protein